VTYRGYVRKGVVVLDGPADLREGTEVEVSPIEPASTAEASEEIPTLYEQLKAYIGKAKDLPEDLSVNHDHYLYGVPKRS
jgi:hypothetical protein